nr:TlpA disulfide reductase family protein [uncultured Draconibacterium sp.]
MKKILLGITVLLVLINVGCSEGFKIKGELTGAADGTKIALVPFASYDVKPEAETTIENGKFSFAGELPEPRLYYLVLGDKQAYFQVMLENSTITVTGEVEESTGREESPVLKFINMEVDGSDSDDYFKSQMAVRQELNKMYDDKNEKFADIQEKLYKARVEKNQSKLDSLQNTQEYKEMERAEKAFFGEVEKRYNAVFEANKETFWGPLMMLNLYSYLTPDARPTFENMSEEARESYYGKMVAEGLYPANRTGEKVPDFTTTDANGKEVSLDDLISDKKVILIDFWASWCAPCRKELPNVKANYDKYAAKGFEVIGFSIDKDPKAWKKAVSDENLEWPNFNDLDISAQYKIKSVPTTYLIDNQGRLIAENIRGEELGKKLEELFEE